MAKKIGVTESTLSRFINGTKDTLSLDQMIGIARIFNVSTDFLLCMTDVPDRKNYDISELGLSAEAARNLYTGRANPQVVTRLLENRRFAGTVCRSDYCQCLRDGTCRCRFSGGNASGAASHGTTDGGAGS